MSILTESLVLLTSAKQNCKAFGSGFAIHRVDDEVLVLTCAHVVADVAAVKRDWDESQPIPIEHIRVNDLRIEKIEAFGSCSDLDLAVLRVRNLDKQALNLFPSAARRKIPFSVTGFKSFMPGSYLGEPREGETGSDVGITVSGDSLVSAWKVHAELESGYSGSPVLYRGSSAVFAVASHSKKEHGFAISVSNLKSIWPDMPEEIRKQLRQTGPQLEELHRLLHGVNVEQLRRLCLECLPLEMTSGISKNYSLPDLLALLIAFGQQSNGNVPLLTVLRRLEETLDGHDKTDLQAWLDKAAHHYHNPVTTGRETQAPQAAGVLVRFNRLKTSSNSSYEIRAWLYKDDQEEDIYPDTEAYYKLDKAQERTRFIEELRWHLFDKYGIEEPQAIIEFALPQEMIGEAVEQWTTEDGDHVGTCYPVVVRPLDRHKDRRLQMNWKSNWSKVRQHADKPLKEMWFWLTEPDRKALRLNLKQKPCAALQFTPRPGNSPRTDFLYQLIKLGTPVAFWSRCCDDSPRFKRAMQNCLGNALLGDLPQQLYRLRCQLAQTCQDQAMHYHLTLLWDDCERRLPEQSPENDFLPGLRR
ncbi:MAG: trypsin-like peptidase domain-containing protein [Gammaproteobacteria bacterium]|nr:trypsin-like peptidase domain-containing protein [Gammaproteobacteria bacterium]